MSELERFDPEIHKLIELERERQVNGLELIASENIVSKSVLEAVGSILTNKYAEGYPGKRYYGGCQYHDQIENLARERLCKLFNAKHANVQAVSGSQANQEVYFATMNPGDKLLSQDLAQGGHLSHGSPVNITGKWLKSVHYGVDTESEVLDYSVIAEQARKEKPQMIVCGASAYPRIIDFKAFKEIADENDAYCLADIAHIAGLVAAGEHPTPVGIVDFTSTTTHKTLRGPRGGAIMTTDEELGLKIDKSVFPGMQGGPLMHVIAGKAVCFREALTPEFKDYAKQIVKNSKRLAKVLMDEGFKLVSNGTDNHLMLIDLAKSAKEGQKHLTGLEAETMLGKAGITVNKNTIPSEKLSPFITSGLRVGTPTVTSRGMKEEEMDQIGMWISRILKDVTNNRDSVKEINEVKAEVTEFSKKFTLYPEIH